MESSGKLEYGCGLNVGAGLPAKASAQSIWILNAPASSRASPLPQGLSSVDKTVYHAKACKMAVILKQNGGHWPPFSASVLI
ncbi:hypothetical protein EI534_19960 [Pseudomonas frederiksbergensis]|nr:hypothetical protein [Pseudomonas frederiksbergensis]